MIKLIPKKAKKSIQKKKDIFASIKRKRKEKMREIQRKKELEKQKEQNS